MWLRLRGYFSNLTKIDLEQVGGSSELQLIPHFQSLYQNQDNLLRGIVNYSGLLEGPGQQFH